MDRPIRPLFPKGFNDEVQVQSVVLSSDLQNDGDVHAMNGASAALGISSLPFQGPLASVRLARIDGELIPFPTNEQLERTREKMRAIVARSLPGTSSRITFTDGYPSMPPTEGNYAVLEELSRVSEALGMGPVAAFDPGRRGAADISFVASVVEAGLDGLGPEGEGSHTVEETVNVPSLERAAKRAALLIHRLTRSDGAVFDR